LSFSMGDKRGVRKPKGYSDLDATESSISGLVHQILKPNSKLCQY
jgi:hypothetical protein